MAHATHFELLTSASRPPSCGDQQSATPVNARARRGNNKYPASTDVKALPLLSGCNSAVGEFARAVIRRLAARGTCCGRVHLLPPLLNLILARSLKSDDESPGLWGGRKRKDELAFASSERARVTGVMLRAGPEQPRGDFDEFRLACVMGQPHIESSLGTLLAPPLPPHGACMSLLRPFIAQFCID